MSLESLDLRDRILELAERYETVVALDVTVTEAPAGRTKPGSRVPPGAQEMLDADEIDRAVTATDEWAEFMAHVQARDPQGADRGAVPAGRVRRAADLAAGCVAGSA